MKEISRPIIQPVRVKVPHNLYGNPEEGKLEASVCLFCRSEQKDQISLYNTENPIQGLKAIYSLNDVKKYYKTFNDLKKLLKEHTHFVCDGAILRHLYNHLGPVFGKSHRLPVQIRYSQVEDLPKAITKVINSSYVTLKGSLISVKIGTTLMTPQTIADNMQAGIQFLVGKIEHKRKNVHSIHLKMESSPSIPVYSRLENEMVEYLQEQVGSKIAKKSKKKVSKIPTLQRKEEPIQTTQQETKPKGSLIPKLKKISKT
jgi:ribosomal protein L1